MTTPSHVTVTDVRRAAEVLDGVAHRTPVVTSRTLDRRAGAEVYVKCENFQRMGAFKFRGAYHAISQLSPEVRARGVIGYSSGNHAQALALAARELGVRATVLMPEDAPRAKRAAAEEYGAEVVAYDRYSQDRAALTRDLAAEHGMTVIPPYDHPAVIAGQGTVALELCEDVPGLDALVVPVGGGGLIAGSAIAATALVPGIRVVGAEPRAADDTARSLREGRRISIPVPRTVADGLATATPGELTFPITRSLVDGIELVTDEEIIGAIRFAVERLKIVLEPSAATALAVVLAGRLPSGVRRVGLIASGGNIDPERLAALLA